MRRVRDNPANPARLLAVAMFASATLILLLGHGATFSGDELVLVTTSPGLDLHTLFEPHGGHLIALPRLVYRVLLEISGLDYLPFRILAVASILVAVWLLFTWARRRVDPWLASGFCAMLLFYGSDYLHMFQGNGFIVVSSIALGVAALLALERGDRRGDLLCCLFLTLGVLTYSVALSFLAGVAVNLLVQRQRRRAWVFALPLALYLAWRIWLIAADVPGDGGGIDIYSLLLVSGWSFQSVAGVLGTLSGLDYAFTGGLVEKVGPAGPPLAVVAAILLAVAIVKRGLGPVLLTAIACALALWTMQVLSYGDAAGLRIPGADARYLYPGAFVIGLVIFAAIGPGPVPGRYLALFAVVVAGSVTVNLMTMKDGADLIRDSASQVRTYAAMYRMSVPAPSPGEKPHVSSSAGIMVAMINSPYGDLGYRLPVLLEEPEPDLEKLDQVMAAVVPFQVTPALTGGVACRAVTSDELRARPGASLLLSSAGGELLARRFADRATALAGSLSPGVVYRVKVPGVGQLPWKLAIGSGLKSCHRPA